jgi:hypothetical protein
MLIACGYAHAHEQYGINVVNDQEVEFQLFDATDDFIVIGEPATSRFRLSLSLVFVDQNRC